MRLSRTHLVPLLAVIAGGAIGVTATACSSRTAEVPAPSPVAASAMPPLIFVDRVRIRNNLGAPPLEGWLQGDDRLVAAAVSSALDQWLELPGIPRLLFDCVEGIEIMAGEAAAARYGEEASGGVILVTLRCGLQSGSGRLVNGSPDG